LSAGDLDELRYLTDRPSQDLHEDAAIRGTIAAILRIADCRRLFGWLGAEHRPLELSARPEAQRPACGWWWRPAG
jgi:hypothetical protein